ncbi:MAG: HAD family hydrolase [Propionicimonas sp.]
MSTPRWPVVFFDLDGTVVNTIPLIIASYEHAMWSVLGVRPTTDEARGWIGQTLYATFSQRYPDQAAELIDSYIAWNLAHLAELLQEYPGVDELLGELSASGSTIGVVTSKRHASAARTLETAGLAGRLPVLVAMEDTAVHKPDPEPLLLAMQRLGVPADECVYIGDAVVDVRAARAAGMASIAVTWGAGERADLVSAGPLVVVDTMDELRAHLLDQDAG